MKGFLRSKLVLTIAAFLMIAAAVVIPLSGSMIRSHAASPSGEQHISMHPTSRVVQFASGGGFSFSMTTDTQCSPGIATSITSPLHLGDKFAGQIGFTVAAGVDPAEEAPEGETLLVSDTANSFSLVIGFISGTVPFSFVVHTAGDVLTACVQGGSGDEVGTVSGTVTFPPPLPKKITLTTKQVHEIIGILGDRGLCVIRILASGQGAACAVGNGGLDLELLCAINAALNGGHNTPDFDFCPPPPKPIVG